MNAPWPSFALVGLGKTRWLPPLPIPLVLFWPFVWACAGVARLLEHDRPTEAQKLRTAMDVFRELRGLTIEVESAEHPRLRIRFL